MARPVKYRGRLGRLRSRLPTLPKPPLKALSAKNLDLCVNINGTDHRTDKFLAGLGQQGLVARRGQPFRLRVSFNRMPRLTNRDSIALVFTLSGVAKPSVDDQTKIVIPNITKEQNRTGTWGAYIERKKRKTITIIATTSPQSIVGKWHLCLDMKTDNRAGTSSARELVYLLFNPWCPGDPVHLSEEAQRAEYVLSDRGLMFSGTYQQPKDIPWVYGQYKPGVLDVALLLISRVIPSPERSGTVVFDGLCQRANPVLVVRAISAMVNANDENGVLLGRWANTYEGGTPPTHWVGSAEILQEYQRTKQPVKYAQCWVFAGVCTTVCRALGIPCRPVTNFISAHDSDGNLTIEFFDNIHKDSIWNFHVWNEAWMRRPELQGAGDPASYDGWQAFDATPQERSRGLFMSGPCPVVAVLNGKVELDYDTAFVYAEVNADVKTWKSMGQDGWQLVSTNTTEVGKAVLTKAVGKSTHEDLTNNYKHAEGTAEERRTALAAVNKATGRIESCFTLGGHPQSLRCCISVEDVVIGEPIKVTLRVKNRDTEEHYSVDAVLNIAARLNNKSSVDLGGPLSHHANFDLKPGEEKEVFFEVNYDKYSLQMLDQCFFQLEASFKVHHSTFLGWMGPFISEAALPSMGPFSPVAALALMGPFFPVAALALTLSRERTTFSRFIYLKTMECRLRKPDIEIQLGSRPTVDDNLQVTVKFKNPLPIALTNGQFRLEGSGLTGPIKVPVVSPVAPGEEVRGVTQVVPRRAGDLQLVARFSAHQLNDVCGFLVTRVEEPSRQNADTPVKRARNWVRSTRAITWVRSTHPIDRVRSTRAMDWVRSTHPIDWVRSTHPIDWVRSTHPIDRVRGAFSSMKRAQRA